MNLNDKVFMITINSGVIPVSIYVINVWNLRKKDLVDLDKIVKSREKKKLWRQSSDENLDAKTGRW